MLVRHQLIVQYREDGAHLARVRVRVRVRVKVRVRIRLYNTAKTVRT